MSATPYYDAGGITLYLGDARELLPEVAPPHDVDLVLTDPPYGIDVSADYSDLKGGGRTYAKVVGDDEPFDPRPLLDLYDRAILWGANHYASRLPDGGRWIVWRKRDVSPLMAAAELAWHNLGGRPVDYFETLLNEARNRDGHLHPTQKPTSLSTWLLDKWTEPGDLVLDPYMGSGPVARSCADLGRRYVGIELVEEYVEAAVRRLAQQTLDLGAP